MNRAIIMAAGKGTRMHSDLPKVMHEICHKPMIDWLLDELKKTSVNEVAVVLGYGKEIIKEHIQDRAKTYIQEPQLGTGHACMQVKDFNGLEGKTLIINGDCPFITSETFESLLNVIDDEVKMACLTVDLENPKSYGRIILDGENIKKIVEFKDANDEERKISLINTGIYAFDNKVLFENLDKIQNNNKQNEYYITDLVEILNNEGMIVRSCETKNIEEVQGINDKFELAHANRYMQMKINEKHLRNGVEMIDPYTTYIGADVEIDQEVTLYPNVYIQGHSKISKNTKIMSNSFLDNAIIGSGCIIDSSKIVNSEVKNYVNIGPNSHIRANSVIYDHVRIGNFVEIKNTNFGAHSKCAHLTYIGDSDVGEYVNFGCGVVTVNYDGKNKFRTVIKDHAFIGSNVNLIAPVEVGAYAVCAAGSTCTSNVEDEAMAIARARQINKEGYGLKYLKK